MKTVKNLTNSVIWLSILAILLGIVLVAYPGLSLVALGLTVAAYLIIHGITLIIIDIKAWRLYIPFNGLLQGILCIILGILLAKYPANIAVYIGVALGLWIIISGFEGIKLSAALRGTGAPWVLMLIMYIIDIIIGCLAIFSPVLSSLSLTIGIGCVLIAHAIISIIDMIVVKKNAKDFENLIVEKLNLK
ncbi:MAG: DUF308 domain-containing protein [Clostridia bacterium]|nr:DUF308 domain-containing protein [Clostridia bacterium]